MIKDEQEVILSVQNLKKYFVNRGIVNKAVDDLNFDLHKGEILGLIGESGSGKTTVGRTLIRLYEQYNGFITLNGRIISGDHLNRSRVKMLRRNMQMIFQDPHASLNGQKSIFSILKEPLIVNGLAKDWIKDLFKDWKEIKNNFRYTFENKAKTLELENLLAINKLADDFFNSWKIKLTKYNIKSEDNFEDKFDELFRYLEAKQEMESEIVNNMYSNTTELMNFYYKIQADYRSDHIDEDEKLLKEAQREYKLTKKLLRTNLKYLKAKESIKQNKKELKEFKTIYKEFRINNQNAFKNYISEFINENRLIKLHRNTTINLDEYAHYSKIFLINKEILRNIKIMKQKLHGINIEDITQLMSELREYGLSFYDTHLKFKYVADHDARVNSIIENEFDFDYSKYSKTSSNKKKEVNVAVRKFTNKIQKCKLDAISFKSLKCDKNKHDLVNAKEKLNNAIEHNLNEIDNYVTHHKEENAQLALKIKAESAQYRSLKDLQSETNALFDKNFNSFIEEYRSHLEAKGLNKKDVKFEISKFTTLITDKKQTLESFNIEVKYLNKDIQSIYMLLGIKHSHLNLNEWLLKAEHYVIYLYARMKIYNLLIKNKIYKSLEDVGLLKQFAYRYPHEFSGGQRQRIVIARALISNPQVIIADEPIASLDISIQAQIVNLLKDLCEKKNIGLIFIAHDLSMVEYIADRILIMHLGKVVESGITNKIYSKPVHPYTKNLFKAIPKISNSNEKFQNISFELSYLKDQQFPNIPTLHKVEEEHLVYGTDEQFDKWTKK